MIDIKNGWTRSVLLAGATTIGLFGASAAFAQSTQDTRFNRDIPVEEPGEQVNQSVTDPRMTTVRSTAVDREATVTTDTSRMAADSSFEKGRDFSKGRQVYSKGRTVEATPVRQVVQAPLIIEERHDILYNRQPHTYWTAEDYLVPDPLLDEDADTYIGAVQGFGAG